MLLQVNHKHEHIFNVAAVNVWLNVILQIEYRWCNTLP